MTESKEYPLVIGALSAHTFRIRVIFIPLVVSSLSATKFDALLVVCVGRCWKTPVPGRKNGPPPDPPAHL